MDEDVLLVENLEAEASSTSSVLSSSFTGAHFLSFTCSNFVAFSSSVLSASSADPSGM
ncbi:hypothetical protein BT69DRAFT_1276159 [Atractiella rhizophila]|nr:hypothetical protein BT69DRAFT_1276159 [Atractiella rhizophila]